MTALTPPAPARRFPRLLRLSVALAAVFGLGFYCGQKSPPLPDLQVYLTSAGKPAAATPARRSPEEVRQRLDQAERWVRGECDEKKQELETAERTLYLLEQQSAGDEALQRLRQALERTRREAEVLRSRLAEIQTLREQLRQADRSPPTPDQAREQEELDELLIRARHAAEKAENGSE